MKNKIVIFIIALILSVLSIGLGREMKEGIEEKTVYLINRSKYGYEYKAIEKGAKSASKEYGVNLQVLAPDFEKDLKTQKILLDEVLDNQPDGLIIYPIDSLEIVEKLNQAKNTNMKVVIINENTGLGGGFDYIGEDYKKIGQQIAKNMSEEVKNIHIYISKDASTESQIVFRAILNNLDEDVYVKSFSSMSTEPAIYPSIVKKNLEDDFDVAICLDEKSLLGLARAKEVIGDRKVIGINNSMEIIKNIDNGNIDEIYVTNYYAFGYSAISKILGKKISQKDSYYRVNRQNLFDKNIEKIIFPVN